MIFALAKAALKQPCVFCEAVVEWVIAFRHDKAQPWLKHYMCVDCQYKLGALFNQVADIGDADAAVNAKGAK